MAALPPPPLNIGVPVPPPRPRMCDLYFGDGGNKSKLFVEDNVSSPFERFDAGVKIQICMPNKYRRLWFSDNPPTWYSNIKYEFVDRRGGYDIVNTVHVPFYHRVSRDMDFDLIGHGDTKSIPYYHYPEPRSGPCSRLSCTIL